MTGTFRQRTAILMDNVGGGKLVGSIIIDQVYARYQHERYLHHPGGGKQKFLLKGMLATNNRSMNTLANSVLRGTLNIAMSRAMIRTTDAVEAIEPREFGDMARSAHIRVIDRGAVVFDRKGEHRLSEQEIKMRRRRKR